MYIYLNIICFKLSIKCVVIKLIDFVWYFIINKIYIYSYWEINCKFVWCIFLKKIIILVKIFYLIFEKDRNLFLIFLGIVNMFYLFFIFIKDD